MTAFVWKDMRHHARQWLWSLLVTTTGGAFIGVIIVSWWSALQWSTAQSSSSEYIGLTHILGSNLITYSGLSVAVVISTTLALTVAAQARSHALWKIIGIPSRRIRRIILAQIGVVGLLGVCRGGGISLGGVVVGLLRGGGLGLVHDSMLRSARSSHDRGRP